MTKRILSILLLITLLLPAAASAASLLTGVEATLTMKLSTRSGPGTRYTELGTYFSPGKEVTAISRAYDRSNGIWWIQVEFEYQNELRRAYTGHKRLDIALTAVPEEEPMWSYTVRSDSYAWMGPGREYSMVDFLIPAGTTGEIITVENAFGQFEYMDETRGQKRRVWLNLSYTAYPPDVMGTPGQSDWYYNGISQPQEWTAPSIGSTVYTRGDTHLIVLWVQAQLKNMGYYVQYNSSQQDDADLTGYLDETTQYAISRFQASAGLNPTGLISQTLVDTIRLQLRRYGKTPTPVYIDGYYSQLDNRFLTPLHPGENRGTEIRMLQTMLRDLGYNVGSIDGAYGNKTLAALYTWQTDAGFCRTSTVTLGHMRALLEQYVSEGHSAHLLP